MYDYNPLWETLQEKNVSTYTLLTKYGLSKGTLDSLKHNRNVTMNTLDWFCQILQVPIERVVHITMDDIAERQKYYREQIQKMSNKK